jgi:hypothetical protein
MHILMGLFMDNLRHGGQKVEGKTPGSLNCKKPLKSRQSCSLICSVATKVESAPLILSLVRSDE